MADMEVDLFGAKITLPEDKARAVIAGRDADKEERRKIAEQLGALTAASKEAADKERKALADSELAKLTNKGEFDKALEIERRAAADKVARIAEKFRDQAIRSAVASNAKLASIADPAARAQLADLFSAQLKASCRFDVEKDSLEVVGDGGAVVLNSEGKPKRADAWIGEILDASPLLKPQPSPGSGAGGDGKKVETPTMARAEWDKLEPIARGAFLAQPGAALV